MVCAVYKCPSDSLRDRLNYDPSTGEFRWREHAFSGPMSKFNGMVAGRRSTNGYWEIGIDRHRHRAHRLAWWFCFGPFPIDHEVDHINGDKLDNRICNLRLATRAQNMQNRGNRRSNSTGYKGVTFSKSRQKFIAQIVANGRYYRLGQFATAEAAHEAYKSAALKLHGDFARAA